MGAWIHELTEKLPKKKIVSKPFAMAGSEDADGGGQVGKSGGVPPEDPGSVSMMEKLCVMLNKPHLQTSTVFDTEAFLGSSAAAAAAADEFAKDRGAAGAAGGKGAWGSRLKLALKPAQKRMQEMLDTWMTAGQSFISYAKGNGVSDDGATDGSSSVLEKMFKTHLQGISDGPKLTPDGFDIKQTSNIAYEWILTREVSGALLVEGSGDKEHQLVGTQMKYIEFFGAQPTSAESAKKRLEHAVAEAAKMAGIIVPPGAILEDVEVYAPSVMNEYDPKEKSQLWCAKFGMPIKLLLLGWNGGSAIYNETTEKYSEAPDSANFLKSLEHQLGKHV